MPQARMVLLGRESSTCRNPKSEKVQNTQCGRSPDRQFLQHIFGIRATTRSSVTIQARHRNRCFVFRLTGGTEVCKVVILIDQPWVSITARPRRRILLPGFPEFNDNSMPCLTALGWTAALLNGPHTGSLKARQYSTAMTAESVPLQNVCRLRAGRIYLCLYTDTRNIKRSRLPAFSGASLSPTGSP